MKRALLISALLCCQILSAQIRYHGDIEDFTMFNRVSSKIFSYILLKPGAKIDFTVMDADTLNVITRVLIDQRNRTEYEYSLRQDSEIRRVVKNIKKSSETRGIGGEEVSAYNNLKLTLSGESQRFQLANISASVILLKLDTGKSAPSLRQIEYVRFTPNDYNSEKVLLIDDNSYTYYATSSSIKLKLEGPVVLKIISRLLFDSTFENRKKYEYQVVNNGEQIASFSEEAYKSVKAIIRGEEGLIPSTGDVNIIKFDKGIHQIEIIDGAMNRDIIFGFYISKSSIELEKK